MAGFVGKFFLFAAVIRQGGMFVLLAVVAILNSVISLYYYARVVKTMFFDFPQPGAQQVEMTPSHAALLGFLSCLTIFLGVYWGPLAFYAEWSLRFFVR